MTVNIDSNLSKTILANILEDKEIKYKELNIISLKSKIEKLKKDFNDLKKKSSSKKSNYKYYFFWEIFKKKYSNQNILLHKRNQFNKSDKINIHLPKIGKALGFNPSLLFLLLYQDKIEDFIKGNEILEKIKKTAEIEDMGNNERLKFIELITKKKINLITPLCPDYEHVKIAHGLYKYTFNKLGSNIGLIGKRLITILNKLHKVFDDHNIKFTHHLLYGDFESYSNNICKRLKVNEKEFQKRLNRSVDEMSKLTNTNCKVGLFVDVLTNKKDWGKKILLNEKKISKKFETDIRYRRLITQISSSRAMLYSSWFPSMKETEYKKLVIEQGAEYSTMGDLIKSRFSNPLVLGLDHPKMKDFYNLNNDLAVIYGKPKYI
jgi:hypothetical protein